MTEWNLGCGDCLDFIDKEDKEDYFAEVKLLLTDAPHYNTLSSEGVRERIQGFANKMRKDGVIIICKDEWIPIQYPNVSFFKHSDFGGSLFERIVFAGWMIKKLTRQGDLVLDPFCGYSATGLAAINMDRNYMGIDNKESTIKGSEQILKRREFEYRS